MSDSRKRPIRVLIGKPGLDGHDVGAKVICRALMDAGMEVIYTGLRRSPAEIARAAVEEDVDAVGLSVLSGAHLELTQKVLDELARLGAADTPVLVGGNIPEGDRTKLLEIGAAAVFATGCTFVDVVAFLEKKVPN